MQCSPDKEGSVQLLWDAALNLDSHKTDLITAIGRIIGRIANEDGLELHGLDDLCLMVELQIEGSDVENCTVDEKHWALLAGLGPVLTHEQRRRVYEAAEGNLRRIKRCSVGLVEGRVSSNDFCWHTCPNTNFFRICIALLGMEIAASEETGGLIQLMEDIVKCRPDSRPFRRTVNDRLQELFEANRRLKTNG